MSHVPHRKHAGELNAAVQVVDTDDSHSSETSTRLQHDGFRIDRVTTARARRSDGSCSREDNNVWIVGDDTDVAIIDAGHDTAAIDAAIAGRHVTAVICTDGHRAHVSAAPELGQRLYAPVLLHPADDALWQSTHVTARHWDLHDDQQIAVGNLTLHVLHTPGHSPGSVCIHIPQLSSVFSGDTLLAGGPGRTDHGYSDFPTIATSIRDKLLTLPMDTVVHGGHGASTTTGAAAAHMTAWTERGR